MGQIGGKTSADEPFTLDNIGMSSQKAGYIDYSFGVSIPGVAGESSATDPGDISSFTQMRFMAYGSTTLNKQASTAILECYPGPPYPHYELPTGRKFALIPQDLRQSEIVCNAGDLTRAIALTNPVPVILLLRGSRIDCQDPDSTYGRYPINWPEINIGNQLESILK